MIHSKNYIYAGYLKDTNQHIFHHRTKKDIYSLHGKFKYIDNKNNIVYFFDKENISYSFSAEKKYDKAFLEKELKKLLEQRDILDDLKDGDICIWKNFNNFKRYYNQRFKICNVYNNLVYFIFNDGSICYLSKEAFLKSALILKN